MIRSMISKTIRSTITTLINPFDGLLSRYFVTLDPVLNSHYEMAAPITFSGDFEIEVEFYIADVSSIASAAMIFGNSADWRGNVLFVTSGGDLIIRSDNDVTISVSNVITSSKLHKIKYIKSGSSIQGFLNGTEILLPTAFGTINFNMIGSRYTGEYFFEGIIANVKFTDQSGASDVVTTFKLDQATANTESSVEGNNSVTYVNIPQSARDLYTLDGNIWTDSAGNTIEVPS